MDLRRFVPLALAMLAACSAQSSKSTEADKPTDPLAAHAESARSILAERYGVGIDEVEIITTERITWPNGAMGCPRKGVMYTQQLIEGYRVILRHGGRDHHYHGKTGGDPFYCAKPQQTSGWIMDR